MKTPVGEEISDDEYALLMNFKDEVCDQSNLVDPNEELDWVSISLGYFIAKGENIKEAYNLSRIARYHYHYWE
jgi:hypothetical protein